MNAKRLLDISETAGMLQCSVAKVRQMVLGDQTLAAVHENYRGFRVPFELRGLRVFDVDDQGAITDVLRKKPAGWLRFDLAEVVRTLSEQAHIEANVLPLSDLIPPAPSAPVESVEERRARYLAWHTEEHCINPRGALQRVYVREAKQNPKADRANIGKDIGKARTIRTEQSRAGFLVTQLVQDGKRKG